MCSIAISPDGKLLASASPEVNIWDLANNVVRDSIPGPSRAVAFSPDGRRAGNRRRTLIENVELGQEDFRGVHRARWRCQRGGLFPDGKLLASGDSKGLVKIWDATSAEFLKDLKEHAKRVNAVAFSPDGQTLASADEEGMVCLRSRASDWRCTLIREHSGPACSVTLSSDGKRLASSGGDGTVRLYAVPSGKPLDVIRCALTAN